MNKQTIKGLKELVDDIVIYGNPSHSKIIGFSKCDTTQKVIYDSECNINLCNSCQGCKTYKKVLSKYPKAKDFLGDSSTEHK
jgi:hypothetical protein